MNFIFPLGIFAFFQVTFIPGFLILRALRIDETMPKRLILSFGLSLMANYSIIFVLTAFHLYTLPVFAFLVALEMIGLAYSYRKEIGKPWNRPVVSILQEGIAKADRNIIRFAEWFKKSAAEKYTGVFFVVAFAIVFCSFAYALYLFMENLGTIFTRNDAVLSWNRWAIEWSKNSFPLYTWEYPQLLPANWSLFYVFVGSPLGFFAKSIMPLFFLGIISSLSILGFRNKALGFWFSIPFTILLMRIMNGYEIMATDGYADTALAFFALIPFLNLLEINENTATKKTKQLIFLGSLFAIGSAMVKQGGLFIVAMYPILAWFMVLRYNAELRKKALLYFFSYAGLVLFFVGPFYIYKELAIAAQTDTSVLPDIAFRLYSNGWNPISQLFVSLYSISKRSYGVFFLCLLLIPSAWKIKKIRPIIVGVLIPYYFIWLFFVSYDTRNLTLAMPLFGIAAGLGLEGLIERHKKLFEKVFSRLNVLSAILILFTAILFVSPFVSKKIVEYDSEQMRELHDKETSLALSNYFETNPDGGKIYTNFPFLYFLPATKDRLYSPFGNDYHRDDYENYFKEIKNPVIGYLFVADYSNASIKKDIETKISSGKYVPVFGIHGHELVKINNKQP
jgi:hypothetical protein